MVRLQLVLLQDTDEGVRVVDVILDDQNLLVRISCVSQCILMRIGHETAGAQLGHITGALLTIEIKR